MSTPEENFETAVDESSDSEARLQAIGVLETANECDSLAEIVTREDLEEQYREEALDGLAHPQCKSTLEALVDDGDLTGSLREHAESLLSETPDGAGGGP
ncbi:hypothetical protein HUG10_05360 [Halorarum halophilum]|uniref:HEAT repeat-containing protein n=1 Tax=Halorarum halophilum TaxID=2743090 RepID=A0A7D5KLP3_9EURY|nr:hypothetical protein [Halobaculum halophilum]QLG27002.1 hypothetical protein HUG10_05360 [Halobaculum halophilum]